MVNNVNMPSFIYENKTDTLSQRSLTFDFKGAENNKFGVGAKILLYYNKNKRAMAEQFPSRGFQSSVSNRLHFGTGSTQVIDSAIVLWPSNKKQILYNLKTNKHYSLYEQDAVTSSQTSVVLDEVMVTSSKNPFNFKHKENNFLLPCSDILRSNIPDLLEENELDFKCATLYRTVCSDLSDLSDVNYDILVFFSPSGIKSLYQNFPDFKQNDTRIAVFGPTTAKAAEEAGLNIDIAAPQPESPSMTRALELYIKKANKNGKTKK